MFQIECKNTTYKRIIQLGRIPNSFNFTDSIKEVCFKAICFLFLLAMQLFYTTNIDGDMAWLKEEEARHCVQVLRKKQGDPINFIDGKGGFYLAQIVDARKRECLLKIEKKVENFNKRPFYLHIAIAPTKNMDRFEWFLEKATEIGVDEITPLICMRSERRKIRLDRLYKILLSATKQSVKAYIPKLNDLTKFSDLIKKENYADGDQCFIATVYKPDAKHLKDQLKKEKKTTVFIGPEGGFSPEEIIMSLENDFLAVNLGASRLRTETAGVVACHTMNLLNGV